MAIDDFVDIGAHAEDRPRGLLSAYTTIEMEGHAIEFVGRPSERTHHGHVDDGLCARLGGGADNVRCRFVGVQWGPRSTRAWVNADDHFFDTDEDGWEGRIVLWICVANGLNVDDVVEISGVSVITNHSLDLAAAPQGFTNNFHSCAAICAHDDEHDGISFYRG